MAEITINELNEMAKLDPLGMIRSAEEVYESKVASVASRIVENESIKLVLLSGPSGSGKTTTANLIADAIRAQGEDVIVLSLDDFYKDHDDQTYPKLTNGEYDYECPEALNLDNLETELKRITLGEKFEIPKYDFKLGRRVDISRHAPIDHGCVIIEGLHALNSIISDSLPKDRILKIFVSVSTNINNDRQRILSGRKIRFIRRLVRDNFFRGSGVERTLSMWHRVLAAEDIYLYPYKETADITFDTFHSFEIGVMKNFVTSLIPKSLAAKDKYLNVILEGINAAESIDEKLIPKASLIREFIPGGIYENLY